jgi:uncharacterized membrane protein YfcA
LETATTLGAASGVLLSGVVPVPILYAIFAAVLLVSAWQMLIRRRDATIHDDGAPATGWTRRLDAVYPDRNLGADVAYRVDRLSMGLGLMYGAGLLSALLGIGSGVLKIPAMDTALRLPIKVSSATSNFMIGVTAAGSAGAYFIRGAIVPEIAGPVALGSVVGALLGARLLVIVTPGKLRLTFVAVLLVLAAGWRSRRSAFIEGFEHDVFVRLFGSFEQSPGAAPGSWDADFVRTHSDRDGVAGPGREPATGQCVFRLDRNRGADRASSGAGGDDGRVVSVQRRSRFRSHRCACPRHYRRVDPAWGWFSVIRSRRLERGIAPARWPTGEMPVHLEPFTPPSAPRPSPRPKAAPFHREWRLPEFGRLPLSGSRCGRNGVRIRRWRCARPPRDRP